MIYPTSDSGDSDIELVACSQPHIPFSSSINSGDSGEGTEPNIILSTKEAHCPVQNTYRPILLILVGIPGSGKTSFAKKLETKGWYRVSQDELQSRQQCETCTMDSLSQGKPTVIDRCNVTKEQRAIWINIANKANAIVGCIVFTTPLPICVSRVAQREQHPNLKGNDPKTESVIFQFAREFSAPTAEEGIDFCRRIETEQEEYLILQQLERIE